MDTGNKDFKYNDKFIDKEDTYRHSKWLSFMKKRLLLAWNLLKDTGVIFISIDDNELYQLKLLCDQVFNDNFVACLPTVMNLKGNNDQFGFAGTHEYTLVYMKNKNKGNINSFHVDDVELEKWDEDEVGMFKKGATLKATGEESTRSHRPKMFYPILFNPKDEIVTTISQKEYDRIYNEESKEFDDNYLLSLKRKYKRKGYFFILPIDNQGNYSRWRWGWTNSIHDKLSKEVIVIHRDEKVSYYKKQRPDLGELPSKKPKSIFYKPYYSSGNGTSQLKDLFREKVFNNPKPIELIKDFIRLGCSKDGIILDFMAGSGTTGHACLDLNKEDSGNRRFVLCTNNEVDFKTEQKLLKSGIKPNDVKYENEGICQKVCFPRLKKAIEGYESRKGLQVKALGGNLKYFKTAFVKKTINIDNMKLRITKHCTDMLCLKEEIYKVFTKCDDYSIFQQKENIMAIYYSLEYKKLESLKKKLDKLNGKKILYCFTLDPLGLDKQDFLDWNGVTLEPIPQKILDIYEGIYEY